MKLELELRPGQYKLLPAAFLFLAVAIIIILFASGYQSEDSLTYAWSIRTGQEVFNPHHLLYNPIVHGLYWLSSQVFTADAIFVAQAHNTFWAIVAAATLFLLLRRLRESALIAALYAILLLSTQGVLLYATQVEVYVPAMGALALASYVLLATSPEQWTLARRAVFTACFVLAIGYHQTSVLFVAPLLVYLWSSDAKWFRQFAALVIPAALICLGLYLLVYLTANESSTDGGFFHFMTLYAHAINPDWGAQSNISFAGFSELVKSQGWCLVDSAGVLSLLPVVLTAGFLLPAGFVTVALLRKRSQNAMIARFLFSWLVAYWVFFLWWHPTENEFFIGTLFPLLAMTAVAFRELTQRFGEKSIRVLSVSALGMLLPVFLFTNFGIVLERHGVELESRKSASMLAGIVHDETVIWPDREALGWLRYEYGHEYILGSGLVLFFKFGRPLPPDVERLLARPLLISRSELWPDQNAKVPSTDVRQADWLAYASRLFDKKKVIGSSLVTVRRHRSSILPDGQAVIRIDTSRSDPMSEQCWADELRTMSAHGTIQEQQ